ncbi:MAG TPA: aminotransferase class IV [Phycisphaerales bacterium]|nr:aminotransferase class IV [Phycisphaerales bacterium]
MADYPRVVLVHLNGQLVPPDRARVSVFDRGFLFGDGLYEGLRSFNGRVVAMDRHVARLREGLAEARIPWDPEQMVPLTEELLEANGTRDAFIYWQITRGEPAPGEPVRARVLTGRVTPTVMGFCYATPPLSGHLKPAAKRVITTRDTRWLRGAMKSISLLGGVLGAIEASEAHTDDAILIRDGIVAEGTSSNVIVAWQDDDGATRIATPSMQSAPILAGVTRDLLLDSVPEIESRVIGQRELSRASEVMLTGTLSMVTSIVEIDGRAVGSGKPGPVAQRLLDALRMCIEQEAAGNLRPSRR